MIGYAARSCQRIGRVQPTIRHARDKMNRTVDDNHRPLTDARREISRFLCRITVSNYSVSSLCCWLLPHRRCSSPSWTIVPRITTHESRASCQEKIHQWFSPSFIFLILTYLFFPINCGIKYCRKSIIHVLVFFDHIKRYGKGYRLYRFAVIEANIT